MSSHTGNVYGFHSTVGLLPDDGIGVVVIARQRPREAPQPRQQPDQRRAQLCRGRVHLCR